MSVSVRPLAAALAAGFACVVAVPAHAQSTTALAQAPNTIEIGADAGAVFGLGDQSSFNFDFPAQKARLGFFLNNDSRVAIEPSLGISSRKVEDTPSVTGYVAELGALYHFRSARLITDVTNRATVSYVRPFIGFEGNTTGGDTPDDQEFFAGAGVGVKIPFRTNIAFRAEANVGYGFDNEAARIGLNLGMSFFTRRDR